MDAVIVTGAASGVGLAIARSLVERGFIVYGLGGSYQDVPLRSSAFHPVPCDLSQPARLQEAVERVFEKEEGLYGLVHNAKRPLQGAFEEASPQEIESVLRVNLLCPLLLTRLCLKRLERSRGFIVTLSANSAERAGGGLVGVAASGGLKWMNEALFEEVRERGIKVSTVFPCPNARRAQGGAGGLRARNTVDPKVIGEAVADILMDRHGNIVTEMVIRPQRETGVEDPPPLNLPYPRPSGELAASPLTASNVSSLIQASEEIRRAEEEEEERREARSRSRRRRRRGAAGGEESDEDSRHPDDAPGDVQDPEAPEGEPASERHATRDAETEGEAKPRPRRRRGGRRRGRSGAQAPDAAEAGTPAPVPKPASAPTPNEARTDHRTKPGEAAREQPPRKRPARKAAAKKTPARKRAPRKRPAPKKAEDGRSESERGERK